MRSKKRKGHEEEAEKVEKERRTYRKKGGRGKVGEAEKVDREKGNIQRGSTESRMRTR